jgi:hypothetical protein
VLWCLNLSLSANCVLVCADLAVSCDLVHWCLLAMIMKVCAQIFKGNFLARLPQRTEKNKKNIRHFYALWRYVGIVFNLTP